MVQGQEVNNVQLRLKFKPHLLNQGFFFHLNHRFVKYTFPLSALSASLKFQCVGEFGGVWKDLLEEME